jgi:Uncharacterized alpha/beta hydrolase domain (DUF2235)
VAKRATKADVIDPVATVGTKVLEQGPVPTSRFIILLDGTWQTDRGESPPTNIVRLRDLILPKAGEGKAAILQQIYYDAGVGTGAWWHRRVWDGLTGAGLEETVRAAYRFLSLKFTKGMEIYVFGFSRGAFSARSLVGYIHAAGLLRAEECDSDTEARAWAFYRTPRRKRIPADKLALAKLCQPAEDVRIACLGVFDTVGTRGVPASFLRSFNAGKYGFHDTNLSSIVDYAFHALALDEKRKNYGATLWSYSFHSNNKRIEQVWFPGCHSDVGGGVLPATLSNIPLYWMIRRIQDSGLGLEFLPGAVERIKEQRDAAAAALGGSGWLYRIQMLNSRIRIVSQTRPNLRRKRFTGLPRYASPVKEALHWSVLYRMQEYDGYEPPNVDRNVLRNIYVDGTDYDTDTVGEAERYLVWWTNTADYTEIQKLLPERVLAEFQENAGPQLTFKPKAASP